MSPCASASHHSAFLLPFLVSSSNPGSLSNRNTICKRPSSLTLTHTVVAVITPPPSERTPSLHDLIQLDITNGNLRKAIYQLECAVSSQNDPQNPVANYHHFHSLLYQAALKHQWHISLRTLHAMERTGLSSTRSTSFHLVNVLCKTGRIAESAQVLSMLWTPFILLYDGSERGLTEREILMRRPDDRIVLQVAHAAIENGKPDVAVEVLTEMERHGVLLNVFTMSVLIKAHGRLSNAEGVTRVLAAIDRQKVAPDLVVFNAAIDAYVRCEKRGMARAVLREIVRRGLKPNSKSFNPVLRSLARVGKVEEIMLIMKEMEKKGVKASGHTFNAIIKGFVMNGEWEKALSLLENLDEMGESRRDVAVGYTIIISALAEKGSVARALDFLEMLVNGGGGREVEGEVGIACAALLTAMLKRMEMVRAWKLFREVRQKFRIRLPVDVYTTMIRGLAKRGDIVSLQAAERVFEEMMVVFGKKVRQEKKVLRRGRVGDGTGEASARNVGIAYNALIDGFVRCGDTASGEKLLDEMEDLGHIPSTAIYTTLIHGYGKELDISSAKRMFQRMRKSGVRPDRVAMNALIGACVRIGNLDLTIRLFEEMQRHAGPVSPDLVTFSALIAAYLREDKTTEAWDAYEEMKGVGVVPNEQLLERMMAAFVSPTLKPSRGEVREFDEAEEIGLAGSSEVEIDDATGVDRENMLNLDEEADSRLEEVDPEAISLSQVEELRDMLTADSGWASKRAIILLEDMEKCNCSQMNKVRWRQAIRSLWT